MLCDVEVVYMVYDIDSVEKYQKLGISLKLNKQRLIIVGNNEEETLFE